MLADNAVRLLHEVVRDGKRIGPSPTVTELRDRFTETFARLPNTLKALRSPAVYSVETSRAQLELQRQVRDEVVARELG